MIQYAISSLFPGLLWVCGRKKYFSNRTLSEPYFQPRWCHSCWKYKMFQMPSVCLMVPVTSLPLWLGNKQGPNVSWRRHRRPEPRQTGHNKQRLLHQRAGRQGPALAWTAPARAARPAWGTFFKTFSLDAGHGCSLCPPSPSQHSYRKWQVTVSLAPR